MNTHEVIKSIIQNHPIVLFMKGSAQLPMCGFSDRAFQILENCEVKPFVVNVLENPEIRQGIKEFSNWPTIPQLYINEEFIGGSDIMEEMYETGELQEKLTKDKRLQMSVKNN